MRILFIMNGIGRVNDNAPGISGGDVRWIEIAKEWKNTGCEIHVLTPPAGVELCKRIGLNAKFHVFEVSDRYSLFSYIVRGVKAMILPKSLENFEGIIYATTEHMYDVLPAVRLKQKNNNNIFVAVVHWVAPLFRKGSIFSNLLFYIQQRIGLYYIYKFADKILAVSTPTKLSLIRLGFPETKIYSVACGVEYEEIRRIVEMSENNKIYDGVYMKRFHPAKGIFDTVEIWREVVKENPNLKLLIIGDGTQAIKKELMRRIEQNKLSKNIHLAGSIYDLKTKIELLSKSQIFILPSYEENWAIVIGEAMAAGIPVVSYDLHEIRPIWGDNVIWVQKGNTKEFAKILVELIENRKRLKKQSVRGVRFIRKFSWKKISERELYIITQNIHKTPNGE